MSQEEGSEKPSSSSKSGEQKENPNVVLSSQAQSLKKVKKFTLKNQNENSNILTIHHTVEEDDKIIRIRLGVCCFNTRATQFVTIDKRGNIFVFDLDKKQHWRMQFPELTLKASAIEASIWHASQYLIGTKMGQLLLLDADNTQILKATIVSKVAITQISFPGQPLQPSELVLVHAGREAIIINTETFSATHRLDFDEVKISLKFASYLPYSEQIFTCFTNDSLHIWSGITLNRVRIVHPIKARDRKIRLMGAKNIPEFSLAAVVGEGDDEREREDFQLDCQDFSGGAIVAYCYANDGTKLCLSTLDNYLLLLSPYTFELQHIYRLHNFYLKQCAFITKPNETLIVGLSNERQIMLLDCHNAELKVVIQNSNARYLSVDSDGKLLAILCESGEARLYSTCHIYNMLKSQEQCIKMLKAAFKQPKPVAMGATTAESLNEDIRKLLKRERLLPILHEYGCYPAKYRTLIWCTLLELPCNHNEFQQLIKLGTPLPVREQALKLKLRNNTLKRVLVKIWSCLARWCKVFAYSEFLPQLIFPFIKLFPKNSLVSFETCATLLLNHFQLWFELHPLEPTNYLGLCQNLLQHYDMELCEFYVRLQVEVKQYAWSMLANAFSEVFDDEQWLCLWDNIISAPLSYPIFCVVAYNILQREVILRLPDSESIGRFFHEQNPIDICKVISKAYKLMRKCPAALQPQRYMRAFQSIPKNVYPKFLNYPKESLNKLEENMTAMRKEHREIDIRLRELELEEYKMMERLESGLKEEEHAKQLKEMEKLYQETLKREEERIGCQRKMLLLYQKEVRSRKGDIVATLAESEKRKKALQMEKDMNVLMQSIERERLRNDVNMTLAEDEMRNQELELLAQKYALNGQTLMQPLAQKYKEEIKRVCRERKLLRHSLRGNPLLSDTQMGSETDNLLMIEQQLGEIQKEFWCLTQNES